MADILGKDLNLVPFFRAHDAAQIDLVRKERAAGIISGSATASDLDFLKGRENLAQALILRLLTPRGSLKKLGHASYGSRLHELIGQEKNDSSRNLCRVFVLEVVAQEPRVEDQAVSFSFDLLAERPSSFVFNLEVQPLPVGGDPLNLSLEVNI